MGYVYDAKWHPTHPAAFASVDGEGHVDIWNLNQNLESPITRLESSPSNRKLALNRCDWLNDGGILLTGDSEGKLSVYAADRSLTHPRSEEQAQFQDRVRQLDPVVPRHAREDKGRSDTRSARSDTH